MYSTNFQYHRAASVQQALDLLAQYGEDAKLLAGGQSLLSVMKLRLASPTHLIDIARIDGLAGVVEGGDSITIGAAMRHAAVASSAVVRAKAPLIAEAAVHIGDPMIRNMGTIGGSLAHADPNADLPAAALAAGALMVIMGKGGQRVVPADKFFVDLFTTVLTPGEVLLGVTVPVPPAGTRTAYEKFPDPASGYAMVGVAAQVTTVGGKATAARVAITGVGTHATRLTAVEQAVLGGATADVASTKATDGLSLADDVGSSAAYKANLARVFTKRALLRVLA